MPVPPARRFFIAGISIVLYGILGYISIVLIRDASQGMHTENSALPFFLFAFTFPLILGRISHNTWVTLGLAGVVFFINTLAWVVTGKKAFFFFYILYAGILFLLAWFDRKNKIYLLSARSEAERNENERNELEVKLGKISEDLEASFHKYSVYYSLREVAEEFATTLSLDKLAKLVVRKIKSFIPKAEAYLLYLAEVDQMSLSLIHSASSKEGEKIKTKTGDIFDLWVLKTRQPLHIADTKKDVRFDLKQIEEGSIRSLIVTPLVDEGRVVGMCRAQSSYPNVFSTEDLRVLYALSVLASPALANALLWQRTHELAIRDSLTGLFVHRHFKDRLKEEHRRALMSHAPLALLMCDLDHFKQYNDTHGHAAGDIVLVRVAQVLAKECPEGSIVARYGGEEFAVLLPRLRKPEAVEIAENIRKRVEAETFEIRREVTRITISIGVCAMPDDTLEREELIGKADQNLYAAKRGGRNKVVPKPPKVRTEAPPGPDGTEMPE